MPPTMSPHHTLLKREDNMGFLLPPTIIVLLIMLASGFCVAMGFAIHSAFGFGSDGNGFKPMSVEQQSYLAEVRIRNMEHLEREGRAAWGRGGGRREGEVVYD